MKEEPGPGGASDSSHPRLETCRRVRQQRPSEQYKAGRCTIRRTRGCLPGPTPRLQLQWGLGYANTDSKTSVTRQAPPTHTLPLPHPTPSSLLGPVPRPIPAEERLMCAYCSSKPEEGTLQGHILGRGRSAGVVRFGNSSSHSMPLRNEFFSQAFVETFPTTTPVKGLGRRMS
ncbi:hypothetical protein E2C01_052772 [Portunus trituberculatus]|uniref:Uncharacterized protein n=1 Tax=Portunus trituberculatus TaxID=210409 RepID=A0A5B7GML9_PORTR|nr:hypothetical protein [Portunus trituberculatus]